MLLTDIIFLNQNILDHYHKISNSPNYYFFADFKENAVLKTDCNEGKLEWVDYDDVLKKEMPFTAKGMLEHYMSTGRFDDKIYGGVTTPSGVVFTEMDEF